MTTKWVIQYKLSGIKMTVPDLTRAEAMEVACHLLDDGHPVYRIGPPAPESPMNMTELSGIHARWVKDKPANHHLR